MQALCLFSGGLDSILAVRTIQEQGIRVKGVFFESPFFTSEKALSSAKDLEIELKILDITDELLDVIVNPEHGHGRGLNPCIDCRILMYRRAGKLLEKEGAKFIISGEVVGQRPMSQNLRSITTVSHLSGFKDLILRPLSAKRLPETLPEKEGWVDRKGLLGLSGRSRQPQMELARKMGIKDYPSPAGGCLLTEKVFSRRLKDLVVFNPGFSRRDIEILKWGRHFRIGENARLVVGRNEKENDIIGAMKGENDIILKVESFPGPTALATGALTPDILGLAASITVSYSDANSDEPVSVMVISASEQGKISARGRNKMDIQSLMV